MGSVPTQGGDLNPPPGPVGPTMKTLTEIEPRIAINATNIPVGGGSVFTITQGGSYYLTGNLTGISGKAGINISLPTGGPGVTIDLMGFELVGVPGSLEGIKGIGVQRATIRNGIIRQWGGDGIRLEASPNNLLADLRVQDNAGRGIFSESGIITGCMVSHNQGGGIWTVGHCTITGCMAKENGDTGIKAGPGSTITACTADSNGGHGIDTGGGCTVTSCSAFSNGGHGIVDAGGGCSTLNCGSTISGCTSSSNGLNGIQTADDSYIVGNTCTWNGLANLTTPVASGIYTPGNRNRIEGNHVVHNGFGIYLDSFASGNLVTRNYVGASKSGTNYTVPGSGNFLGTIVNTSAAMNEANNATMNISN